MHYFLEIVSKFNVVRLRYAFDWARQIFYL
jgi:hypothetical protein